MLKNTKAIICFILFSHQFFDRCYSCPSRLFPTYMLLAKEERLGKVSA